MVSGSIMRKRRIVRLLDINVLGCRIEGAGKFNPCDRLQITIAPFGPFGVEVVWHREGLVGMRFQRLLHTAVIDHIVRMTTEERCPIERRWRGL